MKHEHRTRETEALEVALLLEAPGDDQGLGADGRRRVDDALGRGLRAARRSEQRRERLREHAARVVPTAAVVACVLSVVVAGVVAVRSPEPRGAAVDGRPVAAQAAAAAFLTQAASTARVASDQGAGRFYYQRDVGVEDDAEVGDEPRLTAPRTTELWRSQSDEAVAEGEGGLIRVGGTDYPFGGSGRASAPGLGRPTLGWLEDLPDDPDAVLDFVEAEIAPLDQWSDVDQVVFQELVGLLSSAPVPPRIVATLLDAAARIPGVELEPTATDYLGRVGVGITRRSDEVLDRTVLVLDRGTREVLGQRSFVRGPSGESLLGASAVVERGFVDAVGQRPVPPTDDPTA